MPEADLALLEDAVAEASAIALGFSGPEAKRWDKADDAGPVTEADLAVNESLLARLRAARPDYGWLSEESEDSAARQAQDTLFIVDPIDGTRSFIEGSDTWAISVAVVRHGRPVAGLVALPARGMVFAAAAGQGARLNGALIRCSARDRLTEAQVLAPKPSMRAEHWPGGVPEIARHHRPSLAYRLGLAAQGRFDAMVTLRDAWEWDIAAGAIIASEAGALVTDRRGEPLVFNAPGAMTRGVVVANPTLHSALMSRLTG